MRGRTFQAYEAGGQRPPVQFHFHDRVAPVPAQLLAVDTQHSLDGQLRRKGAKRSLRRTLSVRFPAVHLTEAEFRNGPETVLRVAVTDVCLAAKTRRSFPFFSSPRQQVLAVHR